MSDPQTALQKAFGDVLRHTRLERGLSQERLAFESTLDRTFISLLERGLRQPTLGTLVQLSVALETDAADLVRSTLERLPRRTARKKTPA